MGENYIKVKRVWKYLYRAVDKHSKTVGFLHMASVQHFFDKPMTANGDPNKVAMEKNGPNKAAIDAINARRDLLIRMRQIKHLNNIVAQDYCVIKRVTKPMLNFKLFRPACSVLADIELIHMIRKGQFTIDNADVKALANQIHALAGKILPV